MSKLSSNIISSIQYLKLAQEYLNDFCREHPGTKGANLFSGYSKKIDWIFTDLVTNHHLTEQIREGIKHEINSDLFVIPAVIEKFCLLKPEQKAILEKVIDLVLDGQELEITQVTNDNLETQK